MAKKNQHKGGKGPTPHLRSRTTRSSRGRLVTSDENPNQLLSTQLSLLGLYAAPTIGDGNCLFRALADQVHGSAVLHGEVRNQVCDWIEAHGERYEGFVEVDDGDESDSNARGKGKQKVGRGKGEDKKEGGPSKRLQAYLRSMRENATYGGHMELSAFAHMTRRNIKVVQPGLVYVIEWRAGGSPSSSTSASTSSNSNPQPESQSQPEPTITTPTTPECRRSTRTPSVSASPRKPLKVEEGKGVQKIRTGHGYYVYEEVTSDEEEEDEEQQKEKEEENKVPEEEDSGPTIYVAYHDWEHFSSIRNLRGPHTGLPNIHETPPQTEDLPTPEERKREAAKEREREKKKEREQKEKERKEKERKERGTLKVNLKLLGKTGSATPPTEDQTPTGIQAPLVSVPTLVSLPTSRSASPFPVPQENTTQPPGTPAEHPLSKATSSSSTSEQSHLRSHSRQPHLQGSTPGARAQYRSPKRTFDESSASGGEDAEGREGREKRSRMRMGSISGAPSPDHDVNMEVDVDGEADTPGLSAPSSAASSSDTSSSEAASEISSLSTSPSPAPEPAMTAALSPKKLVSQLYQHHHHVQGEKALTRRQRKALGLPKQRNVGPPGVSAGKIVVPGGRWTGRPAPPTAAVGVADSEADVEWRRNGTGRLDVRGFRELKI